MPRKTEIQTEEIVVSSPLRRSSRTTAASAGTPSSVKTRRGSLLAQENEENIEPKPAGRTRRAASVNKEEPVTKPEPTKTSGRRTSVNSELPPTEEKTLPSTRGRRKSIADEVVNSTNDTKIAAEEVTSRKTIRARRGSSVQEEKVEEQPAVKTPQHRQTVTENDEPKANTTKNRRLSVEKKEDIITEPPKRLTRATRRNSADTAEEPETKVSKPGTPKKPRRRLSVTELVVPLESINEQENETTKLNSKSPDADSTSEITVPPVKKTETKKIDLDLSIINETSFVDESELSPNKRKSPSNKLVEQQISPETSEKTSPQKLVNSKVITSPKQLELNKPVEEKASPKPTKVLSPKNEQATSNESVITQLNPSEKTVLKKPDLNDIVNEKVGTKPTEVVSPKNEKIFSQEPNLSKPTDGKVNSELAEGASSKNEQTTNKCVNEKIGLQPTGIASPRNGQASIHTPAEEEVNPEASKRSPSKKEQLFLNESIEVKGNLKLSDSSSPRTDESPLKGPVEEKNSLQSPQEPRPQLTPIKKKDPPKIVCNLVAINEEIVTTPENTFSKEGDDNRIGQRKISPGINRKSLTPQKLSFEEGEEKELNDVFVDASNVEPKPKSVPTISSGSDGSFSLHLNTSLMKNSSQDSQDEEIDLNTSNVSNGSDKENVDITWDVRKGKQINEDEVQKLSDTVNIASKIETYTIARASNVFRPKNIDYSFVEPMEVDKTMLDNTKLDDSSIQEIKMKVQQTESNETVDKSTVQNENYTTIEDKSFKSIEKSYEETKIENQSASKVIEDVISKTTEKDPNVETNVSMLDKTSKKDTELSEKSSEGTDNTNHAELLSESSQKSYEIETKIPEQKDMEVIEDVKFKSTKEDPNVEKSVSLFDKTSENEIECIGSAAEDTKPEYQSPTIQQRSEKKGNGVEEENLEDPTQKSVNTSIDQKEYTIAPKESLKPLSVKEHLRTSEKSLYETDNNQDIVNTQSLKQIDANLSPNNSKEEPVQISPETECKLLDSSFDEVNKDNSCMEFDFNVPSDDENEEEQTATKTRDGDVQKTKENVDLIEPSKEITHQNAENDMSTEISVIIVEDVVDENESEHIEQNKTTSAVEDTKETIPDIKKTSCKNDGSNDNRLEEKNMSGSGFDEPRASSNLELKTEETSLNSAKATNSKDDALKQKKNVSIIGVTLTSKERITEEKLKSNAEDEKQTIESEEIEKVETIDIDELVENENIDKSVQIVADIEENYEIKQDGTSEKNASEGEETKMKNKRNQLLNVEKQDDGDVYLHGKKGTVSKIKQTKKKSENSRLDSSLTETEEEKSKENETEVADILSPSNEDGPMSSKLDQYLEGKIQEIDDTEETDDEKCAFIDDMAEEGEEDTPSENSNEIVDEGESINTTESEWSDDDYDDNDSFICDEEKVDLLSGEEYDLDDATDKKKKSRIINVEDVQDEVIKIKKPDERKRSGKNIKSRIINVDECEDDVITIKKKNVSREKHQRSKSFRQNEKLVEEMKDDTSENLSQNDTENEKTSEGITENESAENEYVQVDSSEESSTDQESEEVDWSESGQGPFNKSDFDLKKPCEKSDANTSVRRASITIHENIKVNDIQDPALSTRINHLVDSFSKTISKGDVSVNLSMQYEGGSSSSDVIFIDEANNTSKRKKKRRSKTLDIRSLINKNEELSESPAKKQRLSVSLNDSQYTDDEKPSTNRKLSVSTDDLNLKKMRKKKMKKDQKKAKKDLLRGVQNKAISKRISTEELRAETYSLMNQLLNDVRNRPRRTFKPSTEKVANSSWVVEDVEEIKPSTTIATMKDIEEFRAKKIHTKDFKTQLLRDPSRVKRIETKTLLKKKWI